MYARHAPQMSPVGNCYQDPVGWSNAPGYGPMTTPGPPQVGQSWPRATGLRQSAHWSSQDVDGVAPAGLSCASAMQADNLVCRVRRHDQHGPVTLADLDRRRSDRGDGGNAQGKIFSDHVATEEASPTLRSSSKARRSRHSGQVRETPDRERCAPRLEPQQEPSAPSRSKPGQHSDDGGRGSLLLVSSWRLSCLSVVGRSARDVTALPDSSRCLSCDVPGSLRVGRVWQTEFWDALVRDSQMRLVVSRDHFEVTLREHAEPILVNRSSAGTLLNGRRIKDSATLKAADVVAIPSSAVSGPSEGETVASFLFEVLEHRPLPGQELVPSPSPTHLPAAHVSPPELAAHVSLLQQAACVSPPQQVSPPKGVCDTALASLGQNALAVGASLRWEKEETKMERQKDGSCVTVTCKEMVTICGSEAEHVQEAKNDVSEPPKETTIHQVPCANDANDKTTFLVEACHPAAESLVSLTEGPQLAAFRGAPPARPIWSVSEATSESLQQPSKTRAPRQGHVVALRVRLGTLVFAGGGLGFLGIFDTVSFRVLVQYGEPPALWNESASAVATPPQPLQYERVITDDGTYLAQIRSEFGCDVNLPWPPPECSQEEGPRPRDRFTADLYVERVTLLERFDKMFSIVGFNRMTAGCDRVWIGRIVASLPPEGADDLPYPWPVEAAPGIQDCPVPKTLSIASEWVVTPRL